MDELSLLAGARPVDPPEPAVVAQARERLIALARQETTALGANALGSTALGGKALGGKALGGKALGGKALGGKAPRRRRTWQFAWGAGLAAAASVAVVAGVAAGPSGRTTDQGPGPGPASAADLLHRASLVAATEDLAPRADQLVHVTMTEVALTGGGPASAPAAGGPAKADPGGSWLQPTRWQGWESAGSNRPGLVRIAYEAPQALPGTSLPAQARQPAGAEWRAAACTGSFTSPTYAFLSTLPTDPRQLAKRVDAEVRRTASTGAEATWDVLAGLARAPIAPPKLRAAVYELMSGQPGVQLVDVAVDAAGRPGIAVGRTLPDRGIRSELIFAADSYRYLGERDVTTAGSATGLPAGVTVDARAVLSAEVVDAAPAPGPHAQTADCGSHRLTN